MSKHAIGEPDYYTGKWEDARNMLEDAYQEEKEAYYLDPTEICTLCSREIFENEKCKICGQCLRFVNGCCDCKMGGLE